MARPEDPLKLLTEWSEKSKERLKAILYKVTFYVPFEKKFTLILPTLSIFDPPRFIRHGKAKQLFSAAVHDGTLGMKHITDPRHPLKTFVILSGYEKDDNFILIGDWFTGQQWGYEKYENLIEIVIESVGEVEAKILDYVCPVCGRLQFKVDVDRFSQRYEPCQHKLLDKPQNRSTKNILPIEEEKK